MFVRKTVEVFGWSMFYILFSEWEAFAEEDQVYFSYSLVFHMNIVSLLSSNIKKNYFFWGFPFNKRSRLANQLQIISYTFTTFWPVNQSNALICGHGKSILSTYHMHPFIRSWLIKYSSPWLVGENLFSLKPKQISFKFYKFWLHYYKWKNYMFLNKTCIRLSIGYLHQLIPHIIACFFSSL